MPEHKNQLKTIKEDLLELWLLDVGLAQVHFGRQGPSLFHWSFGGDDQQGGCWIRGQFLFLYVILVAIYAQFLI